MLWPTLNPLPSRMYWAYLPGEGDRGAYGVESAELVGERMMIGVHLLGGVGGLLSRRMGAVNSETTSSLSLTRLWIGISCHSMGVMIRGCCLSGMPLLVVGFMIWVRVMGCAGPLTLFLLFRSTSVRAAAKRVLPTPMKALARMLAVVSVMRVLVKEPRKALS